MPWIIFDESDHRRSAPGFCLPSVDRERLCLRDFHEDRNQILFFAHSGDCISCRAALDGFVERYADYEAEQAEILAIFPQTVDELANEIPPGELPFPLLSDESGKVRRAYASLVDSSLIGVEDDLLFVLDRYSAPYAARIASDWEAPDIQDEVLSWVRYIGVQCPE